MLLFFSAARVSRCEVLTGSKEEKNFMAIDMVLAWCALAILVFSALILVSVAHYLLTVRYRKVLSGKMKSKFYPYLLAAGFAFLYFMREFYNPGAVYLLEAKQDEECDEDDQGDPEMLAKQLHRQLRRIRRGESVDRLVLRL
ncbi:MAG TPA: hypothetical protein VFB43_10625 [Terracidiphilus sp.]|nr:hypothetical protein [Terracidiphilus sp.]